MEAIALFRGMVHVLVDTNDESRAVLPPGAFGLPFREAFPQERYRELVAVMDRTFADGVTRTVLLPDGGIVTVRRWVRGQDRGVSTCTDLRDVQSQRQRLHSEFRQELQPMR